MTDDNIRVSGVEKIAAIASSWAPALRYAAVRTGATVVQGSITRIDEQ